MAFPHITEIAAHETVTSYYCCCIYRSNLCFFLKIPESFICLILLDTFWFVHGQILISCIIPRGSPSPAISTYPWSLFWASLLHLLNVLTVSFLSPHCLHLSFCCLRSISALIYLILMSLFCVAIKSFSFFFYGFPLLAISISSFEQSYHFVT